MYADKKYPGLITTGDDEQNTLHKKTESFSDPTSDEPKALCQKMILFRKEVLGGGAGLSAPQIGISKAAFIYTSDRTDESLKSVVNPTFKPMGEEMIFGWEACFSIPLTAVKVPRWRLIEARYWTTDGHFHQEVLEDFEARVFQHETDHIKGRLTLDHPGVEVKTFEDAESFQAFMQTIHSEDAKTYKKNSPLKEAVS